MTLAELRTCMKLKQSNDAIAAEIKKDQESYTRDKAALKAEQAEVNKGNDDIRARGVALKAERDQMATRVTELTAMAQAAKTDAEKAVYETERAKLVERNRVFEKNAAEFTAEQKVQIERVNTLNASIEAINVRSHTINDRVDPQQDRVVAWREQCGNRRFREEDEVVVKKELAAGK